MPSALLQLIRLIGFLAIRCNPVIGLCAENGVSFEIWKTFSKNILGTKGGYMKKNILAITLMILSLSGLCFGQDALDRLANPDVIADSGVASHTLPIQVPPARNGMQPKLAVIKSSDQQNGLLGVGTSLALPFIERDTKFGANYGNVFRLNGVKLVPGKSQGTYHPEIESGMRQVLHFDGASWTVSEPQTGKVLFFGQTEQARLQTPRGTFRWYPERATDPLGNSMSYYYFNDMGQVYPDRILYAAHANGDQSTNSIKFNYSDRDDDSTESSSGVAITTRFLLKSIEIRKSPSKDLVSLYRFLYRPSVSTGRSLLEHVHWWGADSEVQNGEAISGSSIEILSISYSDRSEEPVYSCLEVKGNLSGNLYPGNFLPGAGLEFFRHQKGGDNSLWSKAIGDVSTNIDPNLVDKGKHNQQGGFVMAPFTDSTLADIFWFQPEGRTVFFMNTGNGFSGRATGIAEDLVDLGPNDQGGYFMPLRIKQGTRYGLAYFRTSRHSHGYNLGFLSNGDGSFNPVGALIPPNFIKHSALYAIDWDNDGDDDFLVVNGGTAYFFRNDDGHFNQQKMLGFPAVTGEIQVVDINGDSLPDVVIKSGSAITLVLNAGDRWQSYDGVDLGIEHSHVSWKMLLWTMPHGLEMLLYSGNANVVYRWTGNSLLNVGTLAGDGTRRTGDFSGSGHQEILLGRNLCIPEGLPPDMPTKFTTALGGSYEIDYKPSGASNPDMPIRWLVSEVTANDGRGGQSKKSFKYAGGKWDYGKRELMGFKEVIVNNPDLTRVKSQFNQERPLQGTLHTAEHISPEGAVLSITSNVWKHEKVHFSYRVYLESSAFKSVDDEVVEVNNKFGYDEWGTLTTTLSSGTGGENKISSAEYKNFGKGTSPILRPIREIITGSETGERRNITRDYEPGTGILLREEWNRDDGPNPVVEYRSDKWGNLQTRWDEMGTPTTINYDQTRQYPIERLITVQGVLHRSTSVMDPRFGTVAVAVDVNGNSTTYIASPFGWIGHVIYPDGGEKVVEIHLEARPAYIITRTKQTKDPDLWIEKRQYVDGFGRGIQDVEYGPGGKPIIRLAFWNAKGEKYLQRGPFIADSDAFFNGKAPECPWILTNTDYRGRPVTHEQLTETGVAKTVYAYKGLATTITDPDGEGFTEVKDYLNRVVKKIQHKKSGDVLTELSYDIANDLMKVVYKELEFKSVHNTVGWLTSRKDPFSGDSSTTYYLNGMAKTEIDAKGQVKNFKWDELRRPVEQWFSTRFPKTLWRYDLPGIPNSIGQLCELSNDYASLQIHAFDKMGRILDYSKTVLGDRKLFGLGWNLAGIQTLFRYPDGDQINFRFFPRTNTMADVFWLKGLQVLVEFKDHAANGMPRKFVYGNGVETSRELGKTLTVNGITTMKDNETLFYQGYGLTKGGDLDYLEYAEETTDFRYLAHQLVDDKAPNLKIEKLRPVGQTIQDDFYPITYDGNGNMIQTHFLSGAIVKTRDISFNPFNKPDVITTSWTDFDDGTGIQSGGQTKSSINNGGCFVESAGNSGSQKKKFTANTQFWYDGLGYRCAKENGKHRALYFGSEYEIRDGKESKYVIAAGLRIALLPSEKEGKQLFLHQDLWTSVCLVTDHAGKVAGEHNYESYGLFTGTMDVAYGYRDKEYDAEEGLFDFGGRLYDQSLRRFISPDIFVNLSNPESLDRYAFLMYNPYRYADPSGYYYELIAAAAVGMVVGAISAGMQSHWNVKAMAIGGTIGCISGGIGGYVGVGVFEAIGGAGFWAYAGGGAAGGFAASLTSGVLNTAVYGGGPRQVLVGTAWGTLSGAVFGAMNYVYQSQWPWYRIPTHVATSGGLAALSGGDVKRAAEFALCTSVSAYLYYRSIEANPNPVPGTVLVYKEEGDRSYPVNQNLGLALEEGEIPGWFSERSPLMIALSKTPLFAPMATGHDNVMLDYPIPKPLWDYFFKYTPGHAVCLVITYGAHYAATNPAFYGRPLQ